MLQSETAAARPAAGATARYAWVILLVVFLASVAAPLNQFKVPPVMPLLIEAFNLDFTTAGMLMSVFAITGFVLALPAGVILQRFGAKPAGLTAMVFVAAGAVMGALAGTATLLLGSRFVEGIGMGLIAVVGPAAIAMWFPAEKRGMAMGLWATWVPVGSLAMYIIAPTLATSLGWQAVWWLGAAFAVLALVLYAVFFRNPGAGEVAGSEETRASAALPSMRKAMANRHIWLLSLEFLCFNVVALGINTFYPTFLNQERGYSLTSAAFIASLVMVGTLFSAPLGGVMSDRIGSRKKMIAIPALALAVTLFFPFSVSGWLIPALMLIMGLVSGPIPTSSFAAVPEVMALPQLAGIGMAVLALGQNLGMFIGPWAFGKFVETMSWAAAGYLMIPVCLAGIVAILLVKVR
jgi:MFS family permease